MELSVIEKKTIASPPPVFNPFYSGFLFSTCLAYKEDYKHRKWSHASSYVGFRIY